MTIDTVVMDAVTGCRNGYRHCTCGVQGHLHRDRYRGQRFYLTSRPTAPSLEVEDRATIWRDIYGVGGDRGDRFSSIPSLEGIGEESLAAPEQSRGRLLKWESGGFQLGIWWRYYCRLIQYAITPGDEVRKSSAVIVRLTTHQLGTRRFEDES